ncbi:hypothetical protein Btru_061665 [Bulinus truncatus]|nr:hypothetical protein Btru_061665 [Bulinus truncatus]
MHKLVRIHKLRGSTIDVEGATCISSPQCVATDFTLSTCTNGTCDCKDNTYTPVRSGCVKKATVRPESSRSTSVCKGTTFSLTCHSDISASYEWYLINTKLNTSSKIYQTTAAESSAGNYRCKAKTEDGELIPSEPITVDIVTDVSTIKPVVVIQNECVKVNETITLLCINIPMGCPVNTTFKVNGNIQLFPLVIMSESTSLAKVTCSFHIQNLEGELVTFESESIVLPDVITSNIKPVILLNGVPVNEVRQPLRNDFDLLCATSLGSAICVHTPQAVYDWKENGSVIESLSVPLNTFNLNESTILNVSCSFSGDDLDSDGVMIYADDIYATRPNDHRLKGYSDMSE